MNRLEPIATERVMHESDHGTLRILVGADVPADPNAGASGTVYQMNRALQRMGHDVDEIWQPELGRRIQHGNLHYLLELPRAYERTLRRRLALHDYDVVEFNQPHAYRAARIFQQRGYPGVFVNRSHGHEVRSDEAIDPWRKQFGSQRRQSVRGLFSGCLRPWLDRHWTQIARFADGFHVSCSEDAEFLAARYDVPEERIGVISQGIPDDFINTPCRPMTTDRLRRLLYVGQHAFFKAPMILAEAVSTILESRPDAVMTWVCSAAHHADVRNLLPSDIQSRVTLMDWRPQQELRAIYDEHGLFLFPSFFEGFGKTPLEAMSRGMCVVASCTGGMRDFIQDGTTGRLVPIGQPDVLAQAALSLMNDPAASAQLSTAARNSAVEHTWDLCARDLTMFYHQLLAKRHRSTTSCQPCRFEQAQGSLS